MDNLDYFDDDGGHPFRYIGDDGQPTGDVLDDDGIVTGGLLEAMLFAFAQEFVRQQMGKELTRTELVFEPVNLLSDESNQKLITALKEKGLIAAPEIGENEVQ